MPHLLLTTAALAAPSWTVQVDPLTTALGYAHVQVERAVAPRWSVYLGPQLRLYDSLLASAPRHTAASAQRPAFAGSGLERPPRAAGSLPEALPHTSAS